MLTIAGGIILAIIGLCLLPSLIGLAIYACVIGAVLWALAWVVVGVSSGAWWLVNALMSILPDAVQAGVGLAAGYVAIGAVFVWCAALIIGPIWRVFRMFKPVSKAAR